MSDVAPSYLRRMAGGGEGAVVLASVICRLVIEGAELGALAEVTTIGADGNPRTIRVLPPQWLDRLSRAVDLGVFANPTEKTLRKVVDRILAPPPET
jgi:hypothetical protein